MLGDVLAGFTLLATTKISIDVATANPEDLENAVWILGLGALLAAVLYMTH